MRVFSIGADDSFTEYESRQFEAEHEEAVLQKWLEANPDGILEDGGLLIIGREVLTDLGGFIDLLGLDRQGNVVVVELKSDRTPRTRLRRPSNTHPMRSGSTLMRWSGSFVPMSKMIRSASPTSTGSASTSTRWRPWPSTRTSGS